MRYHELTEAVSPFIKTPAFRAWFGNSKVVDGRGRPKPVFHGTLQDFTVFKRESAHRRSYGSDRLGFWFDDNPETPSYFAGADWRRPDQEPRGPGSGNVVVAYLSIQTPLTFESDYVPPHDKTILTRHAKAGDFNAFDQHLAAIDREDAYEHMLRRIEPNPEQRRGRFLRQMEEKVERFRATAISDGYDGICLPDTYADTEARRGKPTTWWIAFHPNQIKAVIGNRGTFDPDSDDMTL